MLVEEFRRGLLNGIVHAKSVTSLLAKQLLLSVASSLSYIVQSNDTP